MAAEEAGGEQQPTTSITGPFPLKPLPFLVPAASSSPPPRPPVPGLFVAEEEDGPLAPPRAGGLGLSKVSVGVKREGGDMVRVTPLE
jgi:hypothetical protein